MRIIPKYPYQKRMFVNNEMVLTKGEFCSYNRVDQQKACKILSGGAGYILGTIYAGNADGHSVDLSPAYLMKEYGITENTYRNGMDDLRKFGYIIDHEYDNYGLEFYCDTVASPRWLFHVPKTRTGKKAVFGEEIKIKYAELVKKNYAEYTLEEQGIYQLGKMYDGPVDVKGTF